jgi:hypothetical protein
MTPLERVMSDSELRRELFSRLCWQDDVEVEDCAASFVMCWPKLAELWPRNLAGRDVVSLALIDGPQPRRLAGIAYPPLLPAARWCLLAHDISHICFEKMSDRTSRVFVDQPHEPRYNWMKDLDSLMQARLGGTFSTVAGLHDSMVPWLPMSLTPDRYNTRWDLVTDKVKTQISISDEGGGTKQMEFETRSFDHHRSLRSWLKDLWPSMRKPAPADNGSI